MAGTRKSTTGRQSRFASIPSANIRRSVLNRSCGLKTTFNAGLLIPIFVDEVLPGDTMSLRATHFGRLATPINPVFENMYIDTFYFFVPNRLVWDNWQKFNGEQDKPSDPVTFSVPQFPAGALGQQAGTVWDYFGLPVNVDSTANALPFRAYNLIYNEWFRSQDLIDSVPVPTDDGPDPNGTYKVLRAGKRHDYFTSCLPWPLKGGVEVPLPLTGNAPVIPDPQGNAWPEFVVNGATGRMDRLQIPSDPVSYAFDHASPTSNLGSADWGANVGLVADLQQVTAATINELREAFQLQRMYERDARGGTRYTEIVRSHFGVVSPDARLQRPEYLGGGTSTISVNAVAQTSSTDQTTPQGNMAAFGVVGGTGGFTKSFTEHGHIIGLARMRADLNYQQGKERMWSRKTRFDYYWPTLAHLGEQSVLNSEIYLQGTSQDDEVFGYQERYAEYRYKPSRVTGSMRSGIAQPLDSWHLAQYFDELPQLNQGFIEENPPVDRIIAVPTEPHVLLDSFFQYRCVRPMPTYSVPGLIDHF